MPELSNERLAEMKSRLDEQVRLLTVRLSKSAIPEDGWEFTPLLDDAKIKLELITELQQRRASVVTPEMVERAAMAITTEQASNRSSFPDNRDLARAALVSHETGGGETVKAGISSPKWEANHISEDPVERLAYDLAVELEQADLDRNDFVTVNRTKLYAIAERSVDRIRSAIRAAHGQPGRLWPGQDVQTAIEEMRAVATGEYEGHGDAMDPWTADNRADIDRWQCLLTNAPTDETQGVKRANSPPSKPLPDFDHLHGLFSYHAETGKIIWDVPFKAIVAGDEAGSVWNDGYRYIRLDGRAYLAHRIAWLMHYGEAPKRALDHINGVKSDNRISNLRQATIAENNRNRPRPRNNTSGHKGVTLNRATGKFMARIGHNRAVHSLGYFDTAAEAAAAYAAKAKELHGEFHHDQ